jgi:hypothetical protein
MILAKMFISFLLSNWLYSEICYFFPSFDDHARRFYKAVQVPTHDKWPDIANSPDGRKLGKQIYSGVESSGLSNTWLVGSFLDPKLSRVWSNAGFSGLFSGGNQTPAELYLTGDAVFVRESWHPMSQYAYRNRRKQSFVEVESVEAIAPLLIHTHRS